jgi:hypothetical protein
MKLKVFPLLIIICALYSTPILAQIPTGIEADTLVEAGKHRAGSGFQVFDSKLGGLNFSFLFTERYLNQTAIDDSYTDAFGRTFDLKKRQDLQVHKVNLYFTGWLLDPKFRYVIFIWTANATMGQGAQIVEAGNLQYQFNKYFSLGGGVSPLPGVRSLYSNFPFWLRQDARPMADEYFRPSFTTGFFAQGELGKGFFYKSMIANNLSQLGVDAGQLNNNFNTFSTGIWWLSPTYGRLAPYGDFEHHDKIAYSFGGSYTTSSETNQSQSNANAPENSQIRLSDGTSIFVIDAFGPGTQVFAAQYQMFSAYGGFKIKGFSLDGEFFSRWIGNMRFTGPVPRTNLFDNGFTAQASYMILPKSLQFYTTYSYINGQYGTPSQQVFGLNYFPFKNRTFRINPDLSIEHRSPVGYLSYPTVVGATGPIFMLNFELYY